MLTQGYWYWKRLVHGSQWFFEGKIWKSFFSNDAIKLFFEGIILKQVTTTTYSHSPQVAPTTQNVPSTTPLTEFNSKLDRHKDYRNITEICCSKYFFHHINITIYYKTCTKICVIHVLVYIYVFFVLFGMI